MVGTGSDGDWVLKKIKNKTNKQKPRDYPTTTEQTKNTNEKNHTHTKPPGNVPKAIVPQVVR